MMLLVEAFPHCKQDAMVRNPQKKGQHSDFGCDDMLLWLETATNSPGVSLYYDEYIQCSSHQEEEENATKEHAVR